MVAGGPPQGAFIWHYLHLAGIIEVPAGQYYSLALRDDGTVWAWSYDDDGQLGVHSNNDHTIPYQVHGPGNVGYFIEIGPTCIPLADSP
jgi:hypothetical protein